MSTNPSSPEHRHQWWYVHPLTSLITVAVLSALLSIPFGTDTAGLTLAGMLTFLTACKDAYGPGQREN
ncbi:hypothetical protein ACIBM3_30965 [Rhodococcus erythropolis]|uniref:hypothetical protein n=1 Tax=Rhodococcus erythropolis TaxID=1833 RepID=UPI0037B39A8C